MFCLGATEIAIKRPASREQRAEWLHRFAGKLLRVMDITVSVEGEFPEHGAVISNHITYVDIIVYSSLRRCVFVAKSEIAAWPVLGWMTTMSGTVYVKRGIGGQSAQAGEGVRAVTESGLPVVFFPEGTTGDGITLLPFRSGLLTQVRQEGLPVLPAYICYTLTKENGPHATVRDDVSYWADTPLAVHIFNFLKLRGVHAHVRFAETPMQFVAEVDDRKSAALEAHAAVESLGPDASSKCPGVEARVAVDPDGVDPKIEPVVG